MLQVGLGWVGQEGVGLGTGLGGSRRVWLCFLFFGFGFSVRGLMLGCVFAFVQRGGSFFLIYLKAWKGLVEISGGLFFNFQGSLVIVDCFGCFSFVRRRQRAFGEAVCFYLDEDGEESEGDGYFGVVVFQEEMFGWRMLLLVGQEVEIYELDGCLEDCGVIRREEGQRESVQEGFLGCGQGAGGVLLGGEFCFDVWICYLVVACLVIYFF